MKTATPLIAAALLLLAAPQALAEDALDLRRDAVVRAIERARPATVSIRTNQIVSRVWFPGGPSLGEYEREGGLGSGVIFHPDGYVITNAHVIARASKIFVEIPVGVEGENQTIDRIALPVAIDLDNDLAVLRLLTPDDARERRYAFLPLGTSDDLMIGETVIALGSPFRLGFTASKGIVSGLNRSLKLDHMRFDDFLQVDAAINPGNSGGPLLDVTGRWIGVNTAIYDRIRRPAEGIGFAIPASRVRALIARAFKRRLVTQDWLGLELEEADHGGARVRRVYPTGPAHGLGIEPGDLVETTDGRPVPSLFDYRTAVLEKGAGSTVALGLRRGTRRVEVAVPLRPVPTDTLSARHLGFVAVDTDAFDGVRVVQVRRGGPAAKIGLQVGDIVVGLGKYKIQNSEDLLLFLQFVQKGDLVDIRIKGQRPRDWRPGMLVGDPTGRLVAE